MTKYSTNEIIEAALAWTVQDVNERNYTALEIMHYLANELKKTNLNLKNITNDLESEKVLCDNLGTKETL